MKALLAIVNVILSILMITQAILYFFNGMEVTNGMLYTVALLILSNQIFDKLKQ